MSLLNLASALESGELFDASSSMSIKDGVPQGDFELINLVTPEKGRALGLPWIDTSAAGSLPGVPLKIRLSWGIDNGSYHSGLLFQASDGLRSFYVKPASFNPKSPVANPARFFGVLPDDAGLHQLANLQQGLATAGKAAGELLGAAASVTAALGVIGSFGGPLAGVASTLSGIIASGTAAVSSGLGIATTAAGAAAGGAAGAGAAAGGAGAAVGGGAVAGGVSGAAAAATAAAAAAIPLIIAGTIVGALIGLVMAFPAQANELPPLALNAGAGMRVWYLENGKLVSNEFVTGKDSQNDYFSKVTPSVLFGTGTTYAKLEDVDAETFFAGLVYLQAFPIYQTAEKDSLDIPSANYVNLLWTRRTTDEGIAAFRAARAQGAPVSAAIQAAIASQNGTVATPLEAALAASLGPLTAVPRTGNLQALNYLAQAHASNEADAHAYFASPEFAQGTSHDPGFTKAFLEGAGVSPPSLHLKAPVYSVDALRGGSGRGRGLRGISFKQAGATGERGSPTGVSTRSSKNGSSGGSGVLVAGAALLGLFLLTRKK